MRTISYADYYDKVYGGWIGKCIGGNIGAEVENNKYLMDLDESEIFPEDIPPNDDLDLQLLWLQVLERKGLALTSKDLADAWLEDCWYPFNEYGYFLHNYARNIAPPVSGRFNNSYFSQSMGCPIRSEIWGMIAIGNPALAAEYAEMDGVLDHEGESVWAERMLAAMEAEAFFENDLGKLLDIGLQYVPGGSRLESCLRYVSSLHKQGVPWQDARRMMLQRYGHPDASKAVQNLGLTMLALLYGEGDFARTQLIALNCGYDTDCTCATAGAILGIMYGASAIPKEWKRQARDTFTIGIDITRPSNRISDLATDTCRVGAAMAQAKNRRIRIEGIPADLGVERIPSAGEPAAAVLSVDYLGDPALHPERGKTVKVIVRNGRNAATGGVLRLKPPAECEVQPREIKLELPPGGCAEAEVTLRWKPDVSTFPLGVSLDAEWAEDGAFVAGAAFGFAVSLPYYVVGPFWDLYDTSQEGAESYYDPVHRRKTRPRKAENFNNFVSLDREYIPGERFDELAGGRYEYAPEHKLPIDEWMGAEGPACLYVVQDIESPADREVRLVVGNSDPFKIWVNGEAAAESRKSWYWMPYNHEVKVKLRKGTNRIVAKIVRNGKSCDFSLAYSVPDGFIVWLNDLEVLRQ